MKQETTTHQQLAELNEKIAKTAPGYYVQANNTGPFIWSLVNPEGKVC